MDITELRNNILNSARSIIGIKEIPPNMGFENKEFEKSMRSAGWRPGMAWCALTGELVWRMGYGYTYPAGRVDEIIIRLNKLFSANAQATYIGFQDSIFTVSQTPEPGDIGIYKKPNTIFGHMVIVEEVGEKIRTIEGNSGDMVRKQIRTISGWGNYELMGFIKPLIF